MPQFLCVSVRFLQPLCHARTTGDEPEWPPSPLRLFQALVAASAARWNERMRVEYAAPALDWLARLPKPQIVAPVFTKSDISYRLYVPDNAGDRVGAAWQRGNADADISEYRTEKDVRPTHLAGEAVHYVYPIADAAKFAEHKQILTDAARSVTHLGWGVDMVAGNASELTEEQVAKLEGERWRPTEGGGATPLRVPRAGTLQALMDKHTAFLNRLSADGFRPVPPLTAFEVVGYARETDPVARPWVAFRIISADPDGANPAFDTARRCCEVAGWVRHATHVACREWPDVDSFVCGHGPNGEQLTGEHADRRFMYLPLPTINAALGRVESIRRVLLAVPPGFQDRIDWVRQQLPGRELIAHGGGVVGLLSELSGTDWVRDRYVGCGRTWSTVTPVVLHRHKVERQEVEGLLRDAFRYAGFSEAVVQAMELDWRHVGFRAGVDLASQYRVAEKMTGPRYHVRVRFAHAIRGPLSVGAGRYRGLGLFAIDGDRD